MFPKSQWIQFQFESSALDEPLVITAKGWIGDPYERDYPSDHQIELIRAETLDGERYFLLRNRERAALSSDAYEYFLRNFVHP